MAQVEQTPPNKLSEELIDQQRWLYRIRNAKMNEGKRRYNFIQPDFNAIIFAPLLPGKKHIRTDTDIRPAVNLWCSNRAEAEKQCGHISLWDVSSVTDMSQLFYEEHPEASYDTTDGEYISEDEPVDFNDDISKWDVSNVTNMSNMFRDAREFNQDISRWDVSNVTDMHNMFDGAGEFNQDISRWDVSNVTNYSKIFRDCRINKEYKPERFRVVVGGAKKTRRASSKRSRKGKRTTKRVAKRTHRK